MSLFDLINATFEIFGSLLLWLSVRRLYKDKGYSGVFPPTTAIFAAWGYWNLLFYFSLDQWLSGLASISMALANTVHLCQMFYYGPLRPAKNKKKNKEKRIIP